MVDVQVLRNSTGITLTMLKDIGFSTTDFKGANLPLVDAVSAGFSYSEIRLGGYTYFDFKASNMSANSLKSAGFTPDILGVAGITIQEVRTYPGMTVPLLNEIGNGILKGYTDEVTSVCVS